MGFYSEIHRKTRFAPRRRSSSSMPRVDATGSAFLHHESLKTSSPTRKAHSGLSGNEARVNVREHRRNELFDCADWLLTERAHSLGFCRLDVYPSVGGE